ncbi:MAG: apolipoprotein N-acyltransferase [Deltaproteobacteria bacterium]|nr:MAG: apolipoprotein N-acyltransferase [Deltaproteobacteria bacterium]
MPRGPAALFASCLATSILLAVAFPGDIGWWPLVFVALVPLFFVLRFCSVRAALLCGFTSGLLLYLMLLYWIFIVLARYGGLPWFVSTAGVFFLALYMSCYFAAFAVLTRYLFLSLPATLVLWLVPALWVGLDWCRGWLLSGFPWMDLGYALYEVPLLIQVADIGGHHLVSYCIVIVNLWFFFLFLGKGCRRPAVLVPGLAFLLAVLCYSGLRYSQVREYLQDAAVSRAVVGIVQGNIEQDQKWAEANLQGTVDRYLRLSEQLFDESAPELVVWPETALPFYPQKGRFMAPIHAFTAAYKTHILTGAPWYSVNGAAVSYCNGAVSIGPGRLLEQPYCKTHLVPFGEYVPLDGFWGLLGPLVESVGNFTPGRIGEPLRNGQLRSGILICFESVFPDLARLWVDSGANILFNLTNDAWYGKSSAPYQSLAMAVFRAVETRRSLVRSANTGISAFVDPSGEIRSRSALFVAWRESAGLVLLEGRSLWVRFGYGFAPLCLLVSMAFVFWTFLNENSFGQGAACRRPD